MQVQQLAVRFKNLKSVRTTFRNHQHSIVMSGEFLSMPLKKGSRPGPKIDRNVPNASIQATHQLHFGEGRSLIVKSSYGADGVGMGTIDLSDVSRAHDFTELRSAEQPGERAPIIDEGLHLNDNNTADRCRRNFHCTAHEHSALEADAA